MREKNVNASDIMERRLPARATDGKKTHQCYRDATEMLQSTHADVSTEHCYGACCVSVRSLATDQAVTCLQKSTSLAVHPMMKRKLADTR